jgi:CheY-like chemotaxis protein
MKVGDVEQDRRSTTGARVLFVDPEVQSCIAAHHELSDAGYAVDVAITARALFRVVAAPAPRYDVVVVDRRISEVPVDELARRLRTRHPEVAVAAIDRQFDVRRAPYDSWIEVSYGPGALVCVVETASIARTLRRRRATGEFVLGT